MALRAGSILRIAALVLGFLALPARAQEPSVATDVPVEASRDGGVFDLLPADAVSEKTILIGGKPFSYTATAGTLDLFGQDGKRSARIFYTAYRANSDDTGRPVTFLFNGGPGAASAYVHLGLVGPRVLEFGETQDDGTQPVLKDNPDSWLPFTDLVLIDPAGTGWSRLADGRDRDDFYGVRQDAESVAKAIALYVQKSGRMAAPKYIAGESYGGFRAAKVASALKDSQGILVSGIIMISPMIEGRYLWAADDDAVGAALLLPSLAAAALERRQAFDAAAVQEAETFAMTGYLTALAGSSQMTAEDERVYERVSALTGIPKESVIDARGFVESLYRKQSAGDGKIVSPYDAGRAVEDAYPGSPFSRNDDPVLDGYTRAYGGAFAAYARDELGFRTDVTYRLLNEEVNRRWDWDGSRISASAADDIRDLLSVIPRFRLLVAHGYSDTITPFGFSRYVLDHLPFELAQGRTALRLYRGGHMFYTAPASRSAFSAEVRRFFAASSPGE